MEYKKLGPASGIWEAGATDQSLSSIISYYQLFDVMSGVGFGV